MIETGERGDAMIICDSHNHILHNMASGASTVEEAVTMSRALYAQGVHYAVVCPAFHHEQETINRFIVRRNSALHELQRAFDVGEKRIKLIPSCEVSLDPELISLPDLDKLLIPGTAFLPISLSIPHFNDTEVGLITYLMHKRHILPYFVHLERYISFFDDAALDRLMSIQKAVFCLSARALGEPSIVKKLPKYIFQGARLLPMTNAHNLCSMPPELRSEMLHIDGLYADKLYANMQKTSNTFFKPFLTSWRNNRLG